MYVCIKLKIFFYKVPGRSIKLKIFFYKVPGRLFEDFMVEKRAYCDVL